MSEVSDIAAINKDRVNVMSSFTFYRKKYDLSFQYAVYEELEKNVYFFRHYCKGASDEAMVNTFMHVLTHFDPEKGTIRSFIKSLTKTIMKNKNKAVPYDFLDETISDSKDFLDTVQTSNATYGLKNYKDFTDKVEADIDLDARDMSKEFINTVLQNPFDFVKLSNALKLRNGSKISELSDIFIKECKEYMDVFKADVFNDMCISLYDSNKEIFDDFIDTANNWKKSDKNLIVTRASRRYKFMNRDTNKQVLDADFERFYLGGNIERLDLVNKRIFMLNYMEVVDKIYSIFESSETNKFRLTLNNNYIFITPAGTVSGINPEEEDVIELIADEVITNILKRIGGKLFNVGSENLYVLVSQFNGLNLDLYGEIIPIRAKDITEGILNNEF